MNSAEIRETFLSFFEERGHRRMPSASLIPPPDDDSTLLTVAGMQPFKPFFTGREQPPSTRLTSSQACFRTPDIEEVGQTLRHLTFFEMLGNFSIGDYFKEETIRFGWELSTEAFGLEPDRIWVTVFEGDEKLGLGPDTEAIEIWKALGVPDERIIRLPSSENFWQGGPTGPCGPSSELYYDRGPEFGSADILPGGETDRFPEYWNHVFMTYNMDVDGKLTELPQRNIDTGMGLERMAAILQGVNSVYDTDLFRPLLELAEERSGHRYGAEDEATRSMRIVADHTRGMSFLLAAGVVPSNEERGYVLRRVMRRAIAHGRRLGLEGEWLTGFTDRTVEMMGDAHPILVAQQEEIRRWAEAEEKAFGRTLDRGTELLEDLIVRAGEDGSNRITAADAFQLHDTFGFPWDLTRELAGERGLTVDEAGFDSLMEAQRNRSRSGAGASGNDRRDRIRNFAAAAPAGEFVGYHQLEAETGIAAIKAETDGRVLLRLERSPLYPEGGGQVADRGRIEWEGGEATVLDVVRTGDDQVVEIGPPAAGEPLAAPDASATVDVKVDRAARNRTMANHTATHLLHAALRERLGEHAHQAGSSVRPDKLRFDFNHGEALKPDDLAWIEDRVNGWIKDAAPVRWIIMGRDEAERLGAMALFGEKYGDQVRVVEIDGVSRELCGGTHVTNTSSIGLFRIVHEGSSAANVRRIEAITGPAAIDFYRDRAAELERVGELLGNPDDPEAAARKAADDLKASRQEKKQAAQREAGELAGRLAGEVAPVGPVDAVIAAAPVASPKELLQLAKAIRAERADAAVVLVGADPGSGKAGAVALFSAEPPAGISARDLIAAVAPQIGGGGGGSDEMAQAGGKNPEGVEAALDAAREYLAARSG